MAETDRREEILVQLLVIAAETEGVKKAFRNKPRSSESARPAIVILDADEIAADEEGTGSARGRPSNTPQLISMTPEIYILLGALPEDVGTQINGIRRKFIKKVLTSTELKNILGTNGSIRYDGCATGLAEGRGLEGEMGVSFSFTYPLLTNEM